jgi:hypothetical protein
MSNARKTRQVRLARRSSGYWRVRFDIPPVNIFGPETTRKLRLSGMLFSLLSGILPARRG